MIGLALLSGSGSAMWAAWYARAGFFWSLATGITMGSLLVGSVGGILIGEFLPNQQYYGALVTMTYGWYWGLYGAIGGTILGLIRARWKKEP
jgi:CHASE2 domain-containing sensor protein